jgi:hypothetical protein
VSERTDGIKSFFNKQASSPAKPKAKADVITPKKADSKPLIKEEEEIKDIKAEAEGIKSEITPKDEEPGLGDDSNAPNLTGESGDQKPQKSDLKSEIEVEDPKEEEKPEKEDRDISTSLTKRKREEKGGAGHRTKVTRKDSDDSKKAVSLFGCLGYLSIQ